MFSFTATQKVILGVIGLVAAIVAASVVRRKLRGASRVKRFAKTLAIVTGASGGIGRCLALEYARRGCHVVLVARNRENLDKVAAECRAVQGCAGTTVCPCDVTKIADIDQMVANVRGIGLPLGVLVLNAGRGSICNFDESDDTERIARELMEINFFANVNLARKLLPLIKASQSDVLVVSSLSGILATPGRTTYCASKFALQGFFNALRLELQADSPQSVVTLACPGFVQTEFHQRVMTTAAAGGAPERKGHFMSAEECATQCCRALDEGTEELPMTLKGWLGYVLRPLIPSVIDGIAIRVAKSSLK